MIDRSIPEQTAPPSADEAFIQRCNALRPDSCEDWAAKLLSNCEEFWTRLSQGNEASKAQKDAFICMLSEERSFRLACQVVPELNMGRIEGHAEPFQLEILNRLQHMRDYDPFRASRPLRSVFADDQYAEERERFTEAEVYRAELFLYTTASLTSQEKEDVRHWLHMRPQIADTPSILASRIRSLLSDPSAQDNAPDGAPAHIQG